MPFHLEGVLPVVTLLLLWGAFGVDGFVEKHRVRCSAVMSVGGQTHVVNIGATDPADALVSYELLACEAGIVSGIVLHGNPVAEGSLQPIPFEVLIADSKLGGITVAGETLNSTVSVVRSSVERVSISGVIIGPLAAVKIQQTRIVDDFRYQDSFGLHFSTSARVTDGAVVLVEASTLSMVVLRGQVTDKASIHLRDVIVNGLNRATFGSELPDVVDGVTFGPLLHFRGQSSFVAENCTIELHKSRACPSGTKRCAGVVINAATFDDLCVVVFRGGSKVTIVSEAGTSALLWSTDSGLEYNDNPLAFANRIAGGSSFQWEGVQASLDSPSGGADGIRCYSLAIYGNGSAMRFDSGTSIRVTSSGSSARLVTISAPRVHSEVPEAQIVGGNSVPPAVVFNHVSLEITASVDCIAAYVSYPGLINGTEYGIRFANLVLFRAVCDGGATGILTEHLSTEAVAVVRPLLVERAVLQLSSTRLSPATGAVILNPVNVDISFIDVTVIVSRAFGTASFLVIGDGTRPPSHRISLREVKLQGFSRGAESPGGLLFVDGAAQSRFVDSPTSIVLHSSCSAADGMNITPHFFTSPNLLPTVRSLVASRFGILDSTAPRNNVTGEEWCGTPTVSQTVLPTTSLRSTPTATPSFGQSTSRSLSLSASRSSVAADGDDLNDVSFWGSLSSGARAAIAIAAVVVLMAALALTNWWCRRSHVMDSILKTKRRSAHSEVMSGDSGEAPLLELPASTNAIDGQGVPLIESEPNLESECAGLLPAPIFEQFPKGTVQVGLTTQRRQQIVDGRTPVLRPRNQAASKENLGYLFDSEPVSGAEDNAERDESGFFTPPEVGREDRVSALNAALAAVPMTLPNDRPPLSPRLVPQNPLTNTGDSEGSYAPTAVATNRSTSHVSGNAVLGASDGVDAVYAFADYDSGSTSSTSSTSDSRVTDDSELRPGVVTSLLAQV